MIHRAMVSRWPSSSVGRSGHGAARLAGRRGVGAGDGVVEQPDSIVRQSAVRASRDIFDDLLRAGSVFDAPLVGGGLVDFGVLFGQRALLVDGALDLCPAFGAALLDERGGFLFQNRISSQLFPSHGP